MSFNSDKQGPFAGLSFLVRGQELIDICTFMD